jgi:hypothetical protein
MRPDGYLLPRRATLLAMLAIVVAISELPLRRTVREVPA